MRWIPGILSLMICWSCEYETARMEGFAVHGIDISHHQSHIDWNVVGQQPIHFVFVKATEGATLNDSLYCHNWSEMKRVGFKRGAYHFFRPRTNARRQVDNFINWVEMENGDLPPVLDVEVLDGVSKVQLLTGMRTWLYLVELKYNVRPIIYTNLKFYNKYLAGHFSDYPIWIARYNYRQPVMACGRDWDFWQYGNRGELAGIEGYVDFNVFNGSLQELESLCLRPSHVLSYR